ncbi:MAG: hypothetical protein HYV13_00440 [Candidatus Doudnabacteria bacterium]|nr:hypothetical protein [Candidatus Doudnabacteria bacterium]
MIANKEQYAKLVCLFLAEQLRVKRISLRRAADIAQKVTENLSLIDSEQDFLRLIKELSNDFEELFTFEERVFFWVHTNERNNLEATVRAFAIETIPQDPKLALDVMLAAINDETRLDDLKQKFPSFAQFLERMSYAK